MLPAFRPLALLSLLLAIPGCQRAPEQTLPDIAFAPYVAGFTTGHISARAEIRVQLAEDLPLVDSAEWDLQRLFSFRPAIKGLVHREDDRTFVFRPSVRLPQETAYAATFELGHLANVPKELEELRFGFTTIRQGIDAQVRELVPLSNTELTWQRVVLAIATSDDARGQDLPSCFSISQDKRSLPTSWEHEPNGRYHTLIVDSVRRGETASSLVVEWNGKRIASSDKGELEIAIHSINELTFISASTQNEGDQSATLTFSDPLDPMQDLAGLVGFAGEDDIRLDVQGNTIILYPSKRLKGDHVAFVAASLRNTMGRTLGREITVDLTFEELRPSLRLVGNGTILPSSDGLVFPFEAVNLHSVMVRVIRIHERNVGQFLQVNALDGQRELARVGRPVVERTVDLRTPDGPDLGRWNRFHLDLERYFKAEPGAIYRVELSFGARNSAYPCTTPPIDGAERERTADERAREFDAPQEYWYYEDYYYDEEYWLEDEARGQRSDPCQAAYYASRRNVARNVMASDLGIIAKRGNDGSMRFAVSDLRTTAPISGVKLQLMDLQRNVLSTVVTDKQGMAMLSATAHKPFLLMASKGTQRGYLKLDDGSSLSVSEFDVAGEAIDRGLKGFLYGDRGVWRPGDSLFLNFMLQDATNRIPKDHPVILELTDPRGRLDQKLVRTTGVKGIYAFHTATQPDAPTGIWTARVVVGGTSFHKNLRIETVKPNRLKVELGLDDAKDVLTKDRLINLRSTWLHGAPAKSLKARVTATTSRGIPMFKGYEDYVFDDLRTQLPQEEQVVFEGNLDGQGRATFPLALNAGPNAPAVLRTSVVTRIFEPGGDASVDQVTIPFLPYGSYAGLKAPEAASTWGTYHTDTTYRFSTVAIDPQGRPRAGRELNVQIYRMEWNWWWDGSMNGPSNYISSSSVQLRQEMSVTTDAKGRATIDFRVNRPDWGRFAVRVTDPESGHSSAVQLYMDWPGWEGRARRDAPRQVAMLRFNANKTAFTTGEQVTLTIPSAGNGRALVSLETGSRVLNATWIELKEKETKYTFTATPEMLPNVYVHVTVVQPHAATLNDLPIRLYGVIPLSVEDPSSRITPTLALRAAQGGRSINELKTDAPFEVEIAEKSGKRMTYTLAIVDEGLLDLTRFRTPDPWKHFHAREALGVRTWDLYDQVMGAFGRKMQRILALGGSDEPDRKNAARVNRFKPVVRHVGPFELGPGQKARHTFTIQNYVGSVRVMAVATDGERAYGNAEISAPVRKPLMVLTTAPRVLSPGELADIPVNVFSMDGKAKDVQVSLSSSELLSVEGNTMRTVHFQGSGDQLVTFKVRVKEAVGVARLEVKAAGAGETVSERVELLVRQPNLPATVVQEVVVEPGRTWVGLVEPLGVKGSNSAYLEASSIPPVDLGRRLQYLTGYPHGCLEQTVSKAFPQLFIAKVMEVPERYAQEMRHNVEASLRRLGAFQRVDGSFNYWPGGDHYDGWTSVYAGHFMIEAARQGFNVPSNTHNNWTSFQRKTAREWTGRIPDGWTPASTQLLQAYRLYVLALAGAPELASMNRLRDRADLDLTARWMLAASYAHAGRPDVARELVRGLKTTIPSYTQQGQTFGSDLRDEALIAEALLLIGDKAQAAAVVQRMAKKLSSNQWFSTQSTAMALLTVSRFTEREATGEPLQYTLTMGGRNTDHRTSKALQRHDLDGTDAKRTISVRNNGKGLLHVRLVRTGTPMPGSEKASAEGLAMQVEYQLMDGTPIDPSRIEQGTDFRAVVQIAHPGIADAFQQLALTQVFPSGWEIRNQRMEGVVQETRRSSYTYQDIRDDRVMTYFDLRKGGKVSYSVLLNAAYTGRYYLAGAHLEAMYDHTVNARSDGRWVEVVPAGGTTAAR